MSTLPALPELPAEYELECSGRHLCARHRDWAVDLERAGYTADADPATQASELTGRRPLHEFHARGATLLLRRFTHGGLLRAWTGSRFQDPARPFQELVLSSTLRGRGIATPLVVGARARAAAGGGWRLDIVSLRVETARDLESWFANLRARGASGRADPRVLRGAGAFVRSLHEAGLFHVDLTPKNLLLEHPCPATGDIGFQVLDLDRSLLLDPVPIAARERNLRRLLRFVLRRESRGPRALRPRDFLSFLAGYESARGERRRLAHSIWEAHRRTLGWHQLGWRIERLFGP